MVVRVDNLVAASGLPPVRIQDSLGHASYNMTADIYTAVLEELKRTTAEATTKLIPRRPHQAA